MSEMIALNLSSLATHHNLVTIHTQFCNKIVSIFVKFVSILFESIQRLKCVYIHELETDMASYRLLPGWAAHWCGHEGILKDHSFLH